MRGLLTALLARIGVGAHATETTIEMVQQFDPSGAFSVMAPANWVAAQGEVFSVSAPSNGPALAGTAYRIAHRPPLQEFSSARYQGVDQMAVYTQVGGERSLTEHGGVLREYEGIWPGDNFTTHYVVACLSGGEFYASISLVTSKNDYIANRVFYEKMLSTFEIHP